MINRAKVSRHRSHMPAGETARIPARALRLAGAVVLTLLAVTPARAQGFDAVGVRAQGMGGAFIAVSDDATATWWNPAGIAGGTISALFEYGEWNQPEEAQPLDPAARNHDTGFAVAFPALALSYYRLRVSEIGPADSIAPAEPGRQDRGSVAGSRTVATSAFGSTVGQSLGSHFVIATTVRLVRTGVAFSDERSLDVADELDVPRDTGGDLDVGGMARFGVLSVGATVKHLFEPDFGDEPTRIVLGRQARIGVSVSKGKAGVIDGITGAFDVDLVAPETVLGDMRRIALGGELLFLKRHAAVRGGLNRLREDGSGWTASAGGSVGVGGGLYVDGAWTLGTGVARAGWSTSLRYAF